MSRIANPFRQLFAFMPDSVFLPFVLLLVVPAAAVFGLGVRALFELAGVEYVAIGFASVVVTWLFVALSVWLVAAVRSRFRPLPSVTPEELAQSRAECALVRRENAGLRARLDTMIIRMAG